MLALIESQSRPEHDDTGAEVMKEAIYADVSYVPCVRWRIGLGTRCHHALCDEGLMSRRPSLLATISARS